MSESNNLWENPWYSRREWLVQSGILLVLMGCNLWIATHGGEAMLSLGGVFYTHPQGLLISSLMHVIVSYNVLGFAAGCLLAMLPIRKLRFEQKYARLAWYSMIASQLSFLIYGLIKMTSSTQ